MPCWVVLINKSVLRKKIDHETFMDDERYFSAASMCVVLVHARTHCCDTVAALASHFKRRIPIVVALIRVACRWQSLAISAYQKLIQHRLITSKLNCNKIK